MKKNRDLELINICFDKLCIELEYIVHKVGRINVEKLLFAHSMLRLFVTENCVISSNYVSKTNLNNWLKKNNLQFSMVYCYCEYYKEFQKYAIISLYNDNIISYEEGSFTIANKKSTNERVENVELYTDIDILKMTCNIAKSVKLFEIRRLLNEIK